MNLNDIETKVDSPELAAYFAQFGKATYVSADDINTIVANVKLALKNSGMPLESNLGLLKTTDTPPATGKHKGDINSAGTYTNFKDSNNAAIVFTQTELDDNFAYIYVVNNISSKILIDKKGGESAYQIAVNNGFVGNSVEWLNSIKGSNGSSAYQLAVVNGYVGTEAQWIVSLKGTNGSSAYQLAVVNGFVGTEAQWLDSLKGTAKISTWIASTFASGVQVLKDGVLYESNSATVAEDVPGYSDKWVDKTLWNLEKTYNLLESRYVKKNNILSASGLISNSGTYNVVFKVPVIPNEKYRTYGVGVIKDLFKYDASGNFISKVVNGATQSVITIPSDTYFISYYLPNNPSGADSADLSNIMLVKSEEVMQYITPNLSRGLKYFELKSEADKNRNLNKALYLNQNIYYNVNKDVSIGGGLSKTVQNTDSYLSSCGIKTLAKLNDSASLIEISASKTFTDLAIKDNYVYVSMFLLTDKLDYTPEILLNPVYYYETPGGALKIPTLIRSKTTKIKNGLFRADYVCKVLADVSSILVRMNLTSTATTGYNFYLSNIAYAITPDLFNIDTLLPVLNNENKTVATSLTNQTESNSIIENSLQRKKWCLYGTSIEAGGYFDKVAETYNANYLNYGKGGGGIKWDDRVSGAISDVFTDVVSGPNSSWSASWAEKQAYLTAKGITYAVDAESTCYDKNLLTNLDADLFIIGTYGINDRLITDGYVIDKATRKYDRKTIYGAYNYILRKLYEAKPTAKVVILGQHCFGWNDTKIVHEIQREVAKDWCIPFADWGYKMRMSNEVITVEGVEKTVLTATYAPDGAHIVTAGKKVMSDFLIRFLRGII